VAGGGGGRGVGRRRAQPHEEGGTLVRRSTDVADCLLGEHVVEVVALRVVADYAVVLVEVVAQVVAGYRVPIVPPDRHAGSVVAVHVLTDEHRPVSFVL
jgi:hypothetical protein